MKILLINDYGIEIGGAETYLKNLKFALKDKGHDVRVLTSQSDKSIPAFSDYTFKGVDVHSPLRLIPYMFNISSYRTLKDILVEFKPDVVHMHFTFYHTSPSILLALKDIPTVMTTHAHEIIAPVGINYTSNCKHPFIGYCIKCTGALKYYPEILKRIFFKLYSDRIKLYIAPSNYYASIYKNAGFKPISTLYNGIIKKPDYNPVNTMKKNILFVGRLAPEKGAEYAIRALPIIHRTLPNTTLTIVGEGPDKKKLQKLIVELNLEKYVTMTGKVANKETAKFYNDASLVIVPSTYPDNLPTVCIEAMNNARPILASKIGGIPELVKNGENGYLFTPADVEDIAKKSIQILQDKKTLAKLSIGSRKMLEIFTIEKHVEKLITLYNDVIKK